MIGDYDLFEMKARSALASFCPNGRSGPPSCLRQGRELPLSPAAIFPQTLAPENKEAVAMNTAHLSHFRTSDGPDALTGTTTGIRSGALGADTLPRVTPPMPFEVEEFHTQIPEENWRHRLGVPQTLGFPSARD